LHVSLDGNDIGTLACDGVDGDFVEQTFSVAGYNDDADHDLLIGGTVGGTNGTHSNFFVDDLTVSDNVETDLVPSVCRQLTNDLVCNGDAVDFEGGIPLTWSTIYTNNVYWTDTDDADGCGQPNQTPGSGLAACADSDLTNGAGDPYDAMLMTNPFDLSTFESATLEFAAAYNDLGTADLFEVDIWDGSDWVNELTWDEDHWDPGDIVTLDLSAYDGIVVARFRYSGSGWDWWVQVDDMSLSCGNPTIEVDPGSLVASTQQDTQVTQTLTISNVGTADLDWELFEEGAAPRSQVPEQAPVSGLETVACLLVNMNLEELVQMPCCTIRRTIQALVAHYLSSSQTMRVMVYRRKTSSCQPQGGLSRG